MAKVMRFSEALQACILSGEKTTTWRLFDDKSLSEGDEVVFENKQTGEPFAAARLVSVVEKRLCDLSPEDWRGHEAFSSEEEMYRTYERYYARPVTSETPVKIVKFKILSVGLSRA